VSLRDVQTWLWGEGVRRMMLEAGPVLLSHYLSSGFVDQIRMYTGAVNGGEGPAMASWITRLKLEQRIHRECAEDAVLEAFVAHDPRS
jgi:riboflavin biosynthesis pyrimidine reductase